MSTDHEVAEMLEQAVAAAAMMMAVPVDTPSGLTAEEEDADEEDGADEDGTEEDEDDEDGDETEDDEEEDEDA
ncbi:hypothetical protein RNZ50_01180 [Paracoccaceae bacterium Fryx2]|nr:hypothetical protein [Paracoccaceae bacterium Fryx2]